MTDSPEIEPASETADDDDLRHHVSVDSDEGRLDDDMAVTAVPEPTMEMPDPAPEGEEQAIGSPDDPSDEQPVLVVDATLPTPEHEVAADSLPDLPPSELQSAYDCLEIRTPIEELQTFARARLETLVRLGEADRAERTTAALELGLGALREVMGAVKKETP